MGVGGDGRATRGELSPRQREVLALVHRRWANAEIAAHLGVSERTVESHVAALLRAFGVHRRTELAAVVVPGSERPPLPVVLAASARAPLVGRQREVALLRDAWRRAVEEGPVLVVVHGEAGIGKSRLAADLAVWVHEQGHGALLGTTTEVSSSLRAPFDEILGTSPIARAEREPDPRLRRAALASRLSDDLVRHCAGAPTLVVLEDVQWASPPAVDAVVHLGRGPWRAPLLVLATVREPGGGAEALLAELSRLPRAESVNLTGLTPEAAAELVADVEPNLDNGSIEATVAAADGSPLLLRELARAGAASPGLHRLVRDRFGHLDPSTRGVLDAAVVVGPSIDARVLAEVIREEPTAVLAALDRACAAGVVVPADRSLCFRFAHDLFRSLRYPQLDTALRVRLHAATADVLLGPRWVSRPSEVARHACLGVPIFDEGRAGELVSAAASEALDAGDHPAAAELVRMGLDVIPRRDTRRLDLQILQGRALLLGGDSTGSALLDAAADEADRLGDGVHLADAVCGLSPLPGYSPSPGVVDTAYVARARRALELLPAAEVSRRVGLQALLGGHLLYDDPTGAARLVRSAVDEARRTGDPVLLGQTLLVWRFFGSQLEGDMRRAVGEELISLGDRLGIETFSSVGRQQLAWCSRERGLLDEVDRWHREAALHLRAPDLEQRGNELAVMLLRGRLQEAVQLADEIEAVGGPVASTYAGMFRYELSFITGPRTDGDRLERRAARFPVLGLWRAGAALAYVDAGREDDARRLLSAERQHGFDGCSDHPSALAPVCGLARWVDVAAALGDDVAALALATELEPLAGQWADGGALVTDSVDRARALAALCIGDVERALEVASRATDTSRRQGTPVLLARELAVLAGAQHRAGDVAGSSRSAVEALQIAERTGAGRVRIDLARLGLGDGPSPDAVHLTARQQEIVELIATGATNRQVACALGISPGTVRKHLEHAYARLGVVTRTGAVARAVRR